MSHPQLDALRLMSPRSRLMQLVQWGVNKRDWAELLAMGEAAMTKMEEANGGSWTSPRTSTRCGAIGFLTRFGSPRN